MIQNLAVSYLRYMCFIFPLISIGLTIGRILQGMGLGMPSLIITAIRVLIVSTPLALYFTMILDKPIEWIWIAMVISSVVATIISIIWMKVAFRKLLFAIK